MNNTIKGKVHKIGPIETFGTKGFQKRKLVIETEYKYNNLPVVDVTGDNCSKVDGLEIGQVITVEIIVGGREYNGNNYNQNTYVKHVAAERMQPPAQRAQAMPAVAPESDVQDLPF